MVSTLIPSGKRKNVKSSWNTSYFNMQLCQSTGNDSDTALEFLQKTSGKILNKEMQNFGKMSCEIRN